MLMETPDRIPFPEKVVGWFDIAKGLGELALEFVTKQFLYETPSDHFIKVTPENVDRLLPRDQTEPPTIG